MIKILFSILLISSISFAEDVKYLQKNEVAPFTGYLFSPQKELEIRLLNEKLPILEKKIELQEDINEILEQRIANNMKYISSLEKDQGRGTLRETGYFLFGALLTGFIAANVGR